MLDVIGELFCLLILRFSRNTPQDKTSCPLSFDDMIEVFNQLAIFVAKKNFSKNFWDTESFLKQTRPKYVKWQQAWKNRIKHYTPRNKPVYDEVSVEGIIETWDTKIAKGTPQIKTVKISPMFCADTVRLYREANEAHPASTVVKSSDAAEKLRAVVGMDLKFMIGCDQQWEFSDDDAPAPGAADPAIAALPPAAPADDQPLPPAPPVDPCDFTKWDVLNLLDIPLPAQNYDADNFKARHSAHGGQRFRMRLKHSIRVSNISMSVLCLSRRCTAIRPSVAMHIPQKR